MQGIGQGDCAIGDLHSALLKSELDRDILIEQSAEASTTLIEYS